MHWKGGQGVDKDMKQALALYKLAAGSGDAAAVADACCKSSTASLIISNPQVLQYPCQLIPTLTSSTGSPLLIA